MMMMIMMMLNMRLVIFTRTLSETSVILRKIQRDIIKDNARSSRKVTVTFVRQ